MDKLKGYRLLFEIKESKGIDINEQVKRVVSSDSVPSDVLNFISQYKSIPSVETIKYIHESNKSNKLYKRLMNENQSVEDKAIALTNFLTQCTIKLKSLSENTERKEYSSDLNLVVIVDSLNNYYKNNDENAINETFDLVKRTIKSIRGDNNE